MGLGRVSGGGCREVCAQASRHRGARRTTRVAPRRRSDKEDAFWGGLRQHRRAQSVVRVSARAVDGEDVDARRKHYSSQTLVALRKFAKDLGIKGSWKLNKGNLVEVLVEHEAQRGHLGAGGGEGGASGAGSSQDAEESLARLVPSTSSELATWSVEELRGLAGKVNDLRGEEAIKSHTKLRKAELIAELCAAREKATQTQFDDGQANPSGFLDSMFDASNLDPLADNELFSVDPDLYSYLKESSGGMGLEMLSEGQKGSLSGSGAQLDSRFGGSSGMTAGELLMNAMSGGVEGTKLDHMVVAVICGGPTRERGISLNSARSLLDHIKSDKADVLTYYMDTNTRTYQLSNAQLYSNTPSDFDFKLAKDGKVEPFETPEALVDHLKTCVDIVFPMIHGEWGEDGRLQELLEQEEIPFVGSSAATCKKAFDKFKATESINLSGYQTIPSLEINSDSLSGLPSRLQDWLALNKFGEEDVFVIKPCLGGSSIGVEVVRGYDEAILSLQQKLDRDGTRSYVMQPYVNGIEFTLNVVETSKGPIALMPTEIEIVPKEGSLKLFDFRSKYLPSLDVQMHTPPVSFSESIVGLIMRQAEDLFEKLELRDFARFDGWFMSEAEAGRVLKKPVPFVFSDLNMIPGIEQNSFLFRQAACVGLSHSSVLTNVIRNACLRQDMQFPEGRTTISVPSLAGSHAMQKSSKQKVFVLCGGETSERQVSLMSGLNTWLKLSKYADFEVTPFLLAAPMTSRESHAAKYNEMMQHRNQLLEYGCPEEMLPDNLQPQMVLMYKKGNQAGLPLQQWKVWRVPYPGMLFHTVEEVDKFCEDRNAEGATGATHGSLHPVDDDEMGVASYFEDEKSLEDTLHDRFEDAELVGLQRLDSKWKNSTKYNLASFIEEAKQENAVVFMAMHGGVGENGTIQQLFESAGVKFTGSSSSACNVCMDKMITADLISRLAAEGVKASPKKALYYNNLLANTGCGQCADESWAVLVDQLDSNSLCIKPCSDGCSTGVAKLNNANDLQLYSAAVTANQVFIPENVLSEPHSQIPLPENAFCPFIVEPFVETADVQICRKEAHQLEEGGESSSEELKLSGESRWIEVTVGLVGKEGQMRALLPSITIREYGSILTLEEKFQGGTGINLTPPPTEVISDACIKTAQMRLELLASSLGLSGFARIDAFLHVDTAELIVIEVNSIPGLTPSTVLFQQAMAEDPPIFPEAFFRMIVDTVALDA
ncbi:D-alanine--D-alanine ligase [Chloropicon primus]|nr:D-alanine--D-alanine ligase [Chloropicon primus]